MAFIKSDGIVFPNATSLISKYGIVPQDSVQVFYQPAAPTGWTKVTHHDPPLNTLSIDDKALRIVSDIGGLFSGINPFLSTFPATPYPLEESNATLTGTIGATTIDLSQLPAHDHGAGSSFPDFVGSPSASPFRQELRSPIAYAFRSSYRQAVDQRLLVNFRQPQYVRQPNSYRQPQYVRQPRNFQQPRNFRRPFPNSYRRPYFAFVSFRQPSPARQPFTQRIPYSRGRFYNFRQPRQYFRPGGGWRQPQGGWFANYQRPIGGGGGNWVNRQRPYQRFRPSNFQQPRNFQNPFNRRNPSSFFQPRRQPVNFNFQQPNSYRRPYAFRAAVATRAVVNFRAVVNQRNPATFRQPVTYRVTVRYPVVNNVRYATRTLVPGGAIRGDDQNGPVTSLVGGGDPHTHDFVGDEVAINATLDLRLQYIDVIICQFD